VARRDSTLRGDFSRRCWECWGAPSSPAGISSGGSSGPGGAACFGVDGARGAATLNVGGLGWLGVEALPPSRGG